MTSRPIRPRRSPPIRSTWLLRAMATAITLLSFGGMTAYAGTHVQNADAPFKPPVAATATPAPTPTRVAGRTRLAPGVSVTGQAPVTRTRVS